MTLQDITGITLILALLVPLNIICYRVFYCRVKTYHYNIIANYGGKVIVGCGLVRFNSFTIISKDNYNELLISILADRIPEERDPIKWTITSLRLL